MRMRYQIVVWCLCTAGLLTAQAQVNVLTYHNNNSRTGDNVNETVLSPTNVNSTLFGKLFSFPVDGHIYAQPLYVSGLNISGRGIHNVVFVATQHNSVYAFDADTNAAPGGLLWHANLGPSAATPDPNFGARYGSFGVILPEVGITGTPVIDPGSGTLYVDAFTHEGSSYFHKIHALSIADGSERSFSPRTVTASVPGTGVGGNGTTVFFEAKQQLQRAALTLANGIVYVAYGGYDDTDPFHGWIIGFNASTLQPLPNYVFNTTPNSPTNQFGPNAGEGGIWMGGGGLSVDSAGSPVEGAAPDSLVLDPVGAAVLRAASVGSAVPVVSGHGDACGELRRHDVHQESRSHPDGRGHPGVLWRGARRGKGSAAAVGRPFHG